MSHERSASEFVSEAQEVVEEFSRRLLEIERSQRIGGEDPEAINAAFRAIHSLKGLAGLFAATPVVTLAHSLENALDALRLGKIAVAPAVLDVLFETVEAFAGALAAIENGTTPPDHGALLARIDQWLAGATAPSVPQGGPASVLGIDPSILGVLTEYEEHRLHENLRLGRQLVRVHASFELAAIDTGIEELKVRLKEYGEVITYLPSTDATSEDRIDLDILIGARVSFDDLTAGLKTADVTLHLLGAPAAPQGRSEVDRVAAQDASQDRPTLIPSTVSGASQVPETTGEPASLPADVSLRSLTQTVRVDLGRLDFLMHVVGELNVVQASLGAACESLRQRRVASDVVRSLQHDLRTMERKLALLQQGILDVRMVPLGQVFDKLARVVRKLGREAGKEIRLSIAGADTELDKLIVEELSDPLMHMVRNCIDHGIEPRAERVAGGKNPVGHIELRAFQRGNRVVIEVEDDGRGIDWRQIRDTARRRGLLEAVDPRDVSPDKILELVFAPGFSTRTSASTLSGRGVGLDVVKTNISRLSGIIDIETTVGRGTRFSTTLPVTLAIIQALVIRSAAQTFCVPLNAVLESLMVSSTEVRTVEGQDVISLNGRTLPLVVLSSLFGLEQRPVPRAGRGRIYVVVVGVAQHRIGFVVDDLLGQQDVVIKPLGAALRGVPGIAGATELTGGTTVLLLDMAALVEESIGREATAAVTEVQRGAFADV